MIRLRERFKMHVMYCTVLRLAFRQSGGWTDGMTCSSARVTRFDLQGPGQIDQIFPNESKLLHGHARTESGGASKT